jgi:hypothetical protein
MHACTHTCTHAHTHTYTHKVMNSIQIQITCHIYTSTQLKSLLAYGLKGTVTMNKDGLKLVTLVEIKHCGLNVTDASKGASEPANVASYKALEKPCLTPRRGFVIREPAEPEGNKPFVQIKPHTSTGFPLLAHSPDAKSMSGMLHPSKLEPQSEDLSAPNRMGQSPRHFSQSKKRKMQEWPGDILSVQHDMASRMSTHSWRDQLYLNEDDNIPTTNNQIHHSAPVGRTRAKQRRQQPSVYSNISNKLEMKLSGMSHFLVGKVHSVLHKHKESRKNESMGKGNTILHPDMPHSNFDAQSNRHLLGIRPHSKHFFFSPTNQQDSFDFSNSRPKTARLSRKEETHRDHVAQKRRQLKDVGEMSKTNHDKFLTAKVDEVNYLDPLGKGKGYPDWVHRYGGKNVFFMYKREYCSFLL